MCENHHLFKALVLLLCIFQYKMSSLELDYHARDKMIRLLGNRYDAKTDTITIVADRYIIIYNKILFLGLVFIDSE